MAVHPVYEFCGLTLRSEIQLHLPLADRVIPDAPVDVTITCGAELDQDRVPQDGALVALDEAHGTGWYSVTSTSLGHRLRFRDCAEFVVDPAVSTVVVRPHPGGRAELVPVLLGGTVAALVLRLRGETVLHASAVAVDGTGLAIVGQSGRGKSTIAAMLCGAGAELVTDDVLSVETTPSVRCWGGASEVRLRETAAALAPDGSDAQVRLTADRRRAWTPSLHRRGPVALGAIVFPFPTRGPVIETRRIPASEALMAMIACPRINGWKRVAEIDRDFAVLSRVADAVPAFVALVPWGPPFSPETVDALVRLVTPPAR